MATIKASAGAYRVDNAANPIPFTLPSGLAVGDPLFLLIAAISNGFSITVPAGWASVVTTANFGSGTYVMIKRTGGWQTADSTTLNVTVAATQTVTYASVGLDGTLYKPDTFTVGTITSRGSSISTTTAAAAGTGASATLVVSAEKASSHTGAPDAPSVSPATTLGIWEASSTASTPSAYAGIYAGSAADRTLTYTTASANGAAWQIALAAVPKGSGVMQACFP